MSIEKMSNRSFKIVGLLSELNLVEEERDITLANGKKVKGLAIHQPFGKDGIVIEVNGNPIGASLMWTNSITKDGKENPKFKAMKTMMEQYVPKTKATAENPATRVCVTGMLGLNEYPTEQGEWKSRFELSGMQVTRNVKDNEEDMAEISVSGIIKSITPEMNKDGDETGRIKLEMLLFAKDNGSVVIHPHDFIVPEDLASDLQDFYQKGDIAEISLEIQSKTIGAVKKESKGFGRKAEVTSGFTVTELVVIGGEPANELGGVELDESPWEMSDVATLLKEREIMKEQKSKEKKEKSKQNTGGQAPKKQGLGKTSSVPMASAEEDDEFSELPF